MKKYKILALTDHSGHSQENSIYALLSTLSTHSQCEEIRIASRGNQRNSGFFSTLSTSMIETIKIDHTFQFDPKGEQFELYKEISDYNNFDLILMRMPRPISDGFLIRLKKKTGNKVIINDPEGIINCSTKEFLLNFPGLCPPMKLCYNIKEVLEFSAQYEIVLKPLREYGGKGLVKISGDTLNDGFNNWNTLDYLKGIEAELENEGYLAMKFLKNVKNGDKRILVVDGDLLAASLRMPAKDSWLCNIAQGGYSIFSEATQEEKRMIKKINPVLKKHGILIYGVDTLEDDDGKRRLSEINVLSVGGFAQAEKQTGENIIERTVDKIFEYTDEKYGN